MNDSFILYTSDYQLIEGLTDGQLGQLTRALFIYARDGEVINLEPVVRMAFVFIKDKIDRNKGKYQARCEKNRQIALEREARKREARKSTKEHERAQSCTNVNERLRKSTKEHERAQSCTNVNERLRKSTNDHVLHLSDSDSDSDSDVSKETNILEPSKEASMQSFSRKNVCAAEEPQKSSEKKKSKKGEIDYAAIKDYWNEQHDKTNSAMRRLTLMTENRKEAIRGRLKDCKGDISKIYLAIDKAMASDYLNAGHSWASYDWVMTRKYFPKVLEGNYDNTKPAASQQPQSAESRAQDPAATERLSIGERYELAKHRQSASQQSQDNKFRWVIQQNLADLKKNPRNKPAKDSLARFYEKGVLQRLGIDWKPEK